ncbi:ribonuclease H-like domain-containing protein [Lipomyces arxii]|uniref:ribonuclease H-like domain-containing protein n=1 Tax=Lipomyces arxii TaxID=56418 RepID=UPI0034CDF874
MSKDNKQEVSSGSVDEAANDPLAAKLRKLAISAPPRRRCDIRYLLCLDIEATFDKGLPFNRNTHEVIELPCVLVDLERLVIVDEFHTFVKPTRDTTLSNFCIKFTGISQAMVDMAPTFPEAMDMLSAFMKKHSDKLHPHPIEFGLPSRLTGPRNYAWVTHGTADIERFMCLRSCHINRVRLPTYMQGQYIDLKALFKSYSKERHYRGLDDMLRCFGYTFSGREHSGLQDARQVAKITMLLLERTNTEIKCNRSVFMSPNFAFTARTL